MLSRVRPAPRAGERDPGRLGCAVGRRLFPTAVPPPPPPPRSPVEPGRGCTHLPCALVRAPSPTPESGTRGWREAKEGVAGRLDLRRVLPADPGRAWPPAPLTACLLQRRGETSADLRLGPGYAGKTAFSFAFPEFFLSVFLLFNTLTRNSA